jgi:hypothetical protein
VDSIVACGAGNAYAGVGALLGFELGEPLGDVLGEPLGAVVLGVEVLLPPHAAINAHAEAKPT